MNKHSSMLEVPQSEWPYGYLFIETTARDIQKLRCEECVLHLRFGRTAVNIWFKVVCIRKEEHGYSIFAFHDEKYTQELFFAEASYVDRFSSTADIAISLGDVEMAGITDQILALLHPVIVRWIIEGTPPLKDGKPVNRWYVGLTGEQLEYIEYHSKTFARPLAAELSEFL